MSPLLTPLAAQTSLQCYDSARKNDVQSIVFLIEAAFHKCSTQLYEGRPPPRTNPHKRSRLIIQEPSPAGARGYGRPQPMIINKTLLNLVEPLYCVSQNRTSVVAATLCLVGGIFAFSNTWAEEPATELAALAADQVAVVDPVLSTPEPVSEINLKHVRDLESLVDEARQQAQVEYLAEKLRKPQQEMQRYVQLAWDEAKRRAELEPELLIAIMHKESTFRPKVQSSYGAQGLMQVVRRWHREKLNASESLFDPVVNVRVGSDILEEYLALAEGDLSKALTRYSGNARGYATKIIDVSRKLNQVAEMAAAHVATASWLTERVSAEQAG